MDKPELTQNEKAIIANRLRDTTVDFEKTIEHAASILSEITNLTSFAMTPKKTEDVIKYINLLSVDEETVVLMIVSESGKVSNKAVKMSVPYTEESLELLSKTMTYNYKGKTVSQALTNNIIANFETDVVAMSGMAEDVMPNFMKTLEDMLNVNLYMEGLSNIFDIPEYSDISKAKSFIEMLTQKDEITKKLIERDDGITVTIGDENEDSNLQDCSLITASYSVDGKLVGKIGVIGPTRMKYSKITSIIEYLTENLTDTFKLESGETADESSEDDDENGPENQGEEINE